MIHSGRSSATRQVSNARTAPKGLQGRDTSGAGETLIRDLSAANGHRGGTLYAPRAFHVPVVA
jgi:hypothetical protein